MDMQLVAEDFQFPEGPIAMNDGSVILTEIKRQTLTRVKPDGSKETVAETGGGPNGAAIGPDGKIWVANNGGRFEWRDFNGATIPGETYDDSDCSGSSYIQTFLNWADAHGAGYETWTWNTWGTCGSLISSYAGKPRGAYITAWNRGDRCSSESTSCASVRK